MYILMKLTILTAFFAITMAVDTKGKLPLFGQRKLMDFMVQSREVSQENPQRSLTCFDYYIPILNNITAEYEANYAACLKEAGTSRSLADKATQPARNQIENSAEAACLTLKACTDQQDSIEYFECFADAGSDNSKTMYIISTNASDALVNVREIYRLIENDQYRCTNNSERAYIEDTASTYEELQSCLMGLSPVPTTTTTSSPVTMTTVLPTTKTTESITESTTEGAPTTVTDEEEVENEPVDSNSRHVDKRSKWANLGLRKLEKQFP